jgi:hypothetical protein
MANRWHTYAAENMHNQAKLQVTAYPHVRAYKETMAKQKPSSSGIDITLKSLYSTSNGSLVYPL